MSGDDYVYDEASGERSAHSTFVTPALCRGPRSLIG